MLNDGTGMFRGDATTLEVHKLKRRNQTEGAKVSRPSMVRIKYASEDLAGCEILPRQLWARLLQHNR